MFKEEIGNEFIVIQEGTSEGTQIKYRKDGFWYKKDNRGHEGRAEYLVSKFMEFTSLKTSEYVTYEEGTINGSSGCRSRNFLTGEEELITFYRLYYNEVGEYVVSFIKESCELDVKEYLSKIFMLDMICLNEDRHLNNLAIIMNGDKFTPAPIFDNGIALLTANQSVNRHFPIADNVKRVVARPFSGSHEKMMEYFGKGFSVDVNSALDWLDTEPDSMERNVLKYQIERYKGILN